ncbi:MAG TPA: N-acetylmannosamine-6-phosphate 2-epimerase [Acidobacteriota bacterium]|jgi:N-acylglucosamine-6-phosphate 2-epimerase
MTNQLEGILDSLRGGLIVSCQADDSSPLNSAEFQAALAKAAVIQGAIGIRARGAAHIRAIKAAVAVPVIGLEKVRSASAIYITPTAQSAGRLIDAGADVIAFDATHLPRTEADSIEEIIEVIHRAGRIAMADIATEAEALSALQSGADCVATTLAGHTEETSSMLLPAIDLLRAICQSAKGPVFCEGGVQTPAQAREALRAGAHAVVVGTAITGVEWKVREFVNALRS